MSRERRGAAPKGNALPLVAVQSAYPTDPRRDVPRVLERAARSVQRGGIAVLPEYFYAPPGAPTRAQFAALAFVEDAVVEASRSCAGALVATVPETRPEELFNTAIVAEDGKIVHRQRKMRPTPGERQGGVLPAAGLSVTSVQGVRLGILVCADVLALDLVREMGALRPEVVAVPVLSPHRTDDPTQGARTSVFVARAFDLGAYIVKAGGHAEPLIVGRSLITAPWGVLAQASGEFRDTLLSAPFEAARLARVRGDFDGLR